MLRAVRYSDPRAKSSALVLHARLPRQRWWHLVCFGNLSHYYEDGGCEHTDAVLRNLTPYGKAVTKLQPFGGKDRRPKRFARRPQPATEAA